MRGDVYLFKWLATIPATSRDMETLRELYRVCHGPRPPDRDRDPQTLEPDPAKSEPDRAPLQCHKTLD